MITTERVAAGDKAPATGRSSAPTAAVRISWLRTVFLTTTPLISIAGIAYLSVHGGIPLATWALALAFYLLCGVAVSAGYHRLYAHRAYEASAPVEALLLLLGAANFSNSALSWASDHRRHHAHADGENDPHNIKRGFFHAHVGWMLADVPPRFDNVKDLMKRPLVRPQYRVYAPTAILVGLGLPVAIASLWNDPWGGFFVVGFARVVVFHHFMFSINSLAHMFGSREHSETATAGDSGLLAFFTFGEGYHNYHHAHPFDYRTGARKHHFDPAKWLIWTLARLGLARGLRRASPLTLPGPPTTTPRSLGADLPRGWLSDTYLAAAKAPPNGSDDLI